MRNTTLSSLAMSSLVGFSVAVFMLIMFPDLGTSRKLNSSEDPLQFLDKNNVSTASFSAAVLRAAPSVVNIYTKTEKVLGKQQLWHPQLGLGTWKYKKAYQK